MFFPWSLPCIVKNRRGKPYLLSWWKISCLSFVIHLNVYKFLFSCWVLWPQDMPLSFHDNPSVTITRTDPRLRVRIRSMKKTWSWKFYPAAQIPRTACCFGILIFLKQYSCYESATIWYTDHQYFAQYSEIINYLPEIPPKFCNYAVRSCGTWRKGPGQSPCNVLSISDLELYVTETSTGVSDPVADKNVVRMRKPL